MSKTTKLLNYIRDRGKISTAELARFGAEMFCFSISRRARELRDDKLINIRKMTKDEKALYRVKNGGWIYEYLLRDKNGQGRFYL